MKERNDSLEEIFSFPFFHTSHSVHALRNMGTKLNTGICLCPEHSVGEEPKSEANY